MCEYSLFHQNKPNQHTAQTLTSFLPASSSTQRVDLSQVWLMSIRERYNPLTWMFWGGGTPKRITQHTHKHTHRLNSGSEWTCGTTGWSRPAGSERFRVRLQWGEAVSQCVGLRGEPKPEGLSGGFAASMHEAYKELLDQWQNNWDLCWCCCCDKIITLWSEKFSRCSTEGGGVSRTPGEQRLIQNKC